MKSKYILPNLPEGVVNDLVIFCRYVLLPPKTFGPITDSNVPSQPRREKANRTEFAFRTELKNRGFSLFSSAVKQPHSCSFALRPISNRLTKRGLLKAISILCTLNQFTSWPHI